MRLFAGTPFDIPPRCDRCGSLEAECHCPPASAPRVPRDKQVARLAVEKRKKGKHVTVIRGLIHGEAEAAELLTQLNRNVGPAERSRRASWRFRAHTRNAFGRCSLNWDTECRADRRPVNWKQGARG